MGAAVQVRQVNCSVHGPMAYDQATDSYACGLGGACVPWFPRAALVPYFDLTDEVLVLIPPKGETP